MTAPPRTLHRIELALTLRAPWLVHGNDPGSHGLDAVQLRGPDGWRVLPGTLLAGRIREAWRDLGTKFGLQDAPQDVAWFGPLDNADKDEDASASPNSANLRGRRPVRTRVHVDDLVECPSSAKHAGIATRVMIHADSGAGSDGMLLAVEQLELPGTSVDFSGIWHAWLAQGEANLLAGHIAKALHWQTQLGAERSVGFGELTDVQLRVLTGARPGITAGAQNPTTQIDAFVAGHQGAPRGIRLRFTQPLAVGNRRIKDNLYQSSDSIPGAAIKGALATALRHLHPGKPMPDWFDPLRITHALPCAGPARPAPLPLSLVAGKAANGTPRIWDLAHSANLAPLDDKGQAVRFQPDWKPKDEDLACTGQGWGRTGRHLRVRTAIHEGQAKDGQLFAYDCVVAAANPTGEDADPSAPTPTSTHWSATLDLPADPKFDRREVWRDIAALLHQSPLGPIGKTDAFASVELAGGLGPVWQANTGVTEGAEITVVLVTQALLFPTAAVLNHTSADLLGPAPTVDLDKVYGKAFKEVAAATPPQSGGAATALALVRHFSRQAMVGGDYLDKRFGRATGAGARYLPQMLIEPGSVFVFKVIDARLATALLTHWQQHGLPLGKSVVDAYTDHWERNPWLPQNGYGEVLVNPCTNFVAP